MEIDIRKVLGAALIVLVVFLVAGELQRARAVERSLTSVADALEAIRAAATVPVVIPSTPVVLEPEPVTA